MKIIALKGLSNGVKVGGVYEERDGIAKFLISKGLAREFVAVTAPEPPRQPVDPVPVKAVAPPVAPDPAPPAPDPAPDPEPPRRRPGRPVGASTYQRRDLKAED